MFRLFTLLPLSVQYLHVRLVRLEEFLATCRQAYGQKRKKLTSTKYCFIDLELLTLQLMTSQHVSRVGTSRCVFLRTWCRTLGMASFVVAPVALYVVSRLLHYVAPTVCIRHVQGRLGCRQG